MVLNLKSDAKKKILTHIIRLVCSYKSIFGCPAPNLKKFFEKNANYIEREFVTDFVYLSFYASDFIVIEKPLYIRQSSFQMTIFRHAICTITISKKTLLDFFPRGSKRISNWVKYNNRNLYILLFNVIYSI